MEKKLNHETSDREGNRDAAMQARYQNYRRRAGLGDRAMQTNKAMDVKTLRAVMVSDFALPPSPMLAGKSGMAPEKLRFVWEGPILRMKMLWRHLTRFQPIERRTATYSIRRG
ncbi:MAG: hypothetical protein Q7Q71_07590 [Verrucomicrobiota bacterium JB023]|nr:hypothetical protein [Verrucomicrobiota bacterium JB023]